MPRALIPSDLTDTQKLYQYLQEQERERLALQRRVMGLEVENEIGVEKLDLATIRAALQASGSHPLNLVGLQGTSLAEQNPNFPRVTTLPDPQSTIYTAVILLGTGGAQDQLHVLNKDNTTYQWTQINVTPSNFWTTNSVQTIAAGAAKTLADLLTLNAGLLITAGNAEMRSTANVQSTLMLGGSAAQHGAKVEFVWKDQELTLAGSVTKDTTSTHLPRFSLILAVLTLITETISGGGVTTYSVGDSATAARFRNADANLGVGTGAWCSNHWKGSVATEAAGPTQTSDGEVRITLDAAPTAGKIRVVTLSLVSTVPTS